MSEINLENTQTSFADIKCEAAAAMKAVYSDIYSKVSILPPNRAALAIIQEESTQINQYVRKLEEKLKKISIQAALEAGVAANRTEIMWANVTNATGIPQVQLCKQADIKTTPEVQPSKSTKATQAEVNRLKAVRNKWATATAATGATLVAVLIVPGVSGIIKVAGLFVVGYEAVRTFEAGKKCGEIDRIYNEERQKKREQEDAKKVFQTICDKQCSINTKVITGWIDAVEREVTARCHS